MFAFRSAFPVQYAGTDFVLPFAIMDGDGGAVDLTGATITIALRFNGAEVLTGTNSDATVSTIERSSCVALFSASETAALSPGIYCVNITVTDASGQVTRTHQGRITVRGNDE